MISFNMIFRQIEFWKYLTLHVEICTTLCTHCWKMKYLVSPGVTHPPILFARTFHHTCFELKSVASVTRIATYRNTFHWFKTPCKSLTVACDFLICFTFCLLVILCFRLFVILCFRLFVISSFQPFVISSFLPFVFHL